MYSASLRGLPTLHTAVGAPPLASGPYLDFVKSAQDRLEKAIKSSERGDASRLNAERLAHEAADAADNDTRMSKYAASVREYGIASEAYGEMGADYYNALLSYEGAVGSLRKSRLLIGGVLGGGLVLAFVAGSLVGYFAARSGVSEDF